MELLLMQFVSQGQDTHRKNGGVKNEKKITNKIIINIKFKSFTQKKKIKS